MSPDDLLRQNARDVETGRLCRVGIMDGDAGPWVLGVTFLSNVVAVFDVGNSEDEVRQTGKVLRLQGPWSVGAWYMRSVVTCASYWSL